MFHFQGYPFPGRVATDLKAARLLSEQRLDPKKFDCKRMRSPGLKA
jgi:hypothetical protein